MRHVLRCETLNVLLLSFSSLTLLMAPLFQELSLAQAQDVDPPYISHQPIRVAIQGRPMNVVAHIFDESQIAGVSMTITSDGHAVTGELPKRQTAGPVPVVAKAVGEIPLYFRPDTSSGVKGTLADREAVNVTRVRGEFLRIRTPLGRAGYVKASDCEIVVEGSMYGVAIPANMLAGGTLSYQITAKDINGNVEKTEAMDVRVLTQEELMALQSGTVPTSLARGETPKMKKGGTGLGKVAFLTGVAIAGGGAYYLYSQNKTTAAEDKGTVDLVLTWK